MNNLPNELIDNIIGYGFSWISDFRLVSKQAKKRVDLMNSSLCDYCIEDHRHNYTIKWKYKVYNINVSAEDRKKNILLFIISEITNTLKENRHKRITNFICASVYNTVFHVSFMYSLNDKIYKRLERLFDKSFEDCYYDGSNDFCIEYAMHIVRFYQIIFGGLQYYTRFYKKTHVKDLLQERLNLAITK